MFQQIAERLARRASWPRTGALLVLYVVLLSIMTAGEDRIKALSGGLGVPDLMRFLTADELYARLTAFGDEGLRIYLRTEIIDLVYPLVYAGFFVGVITLSIRRRFGEKSRLLQLCMLPIFAMLCDYLENVGLFTVLFSWPSRVVAAAWVAAAGNWGKWITVGLMLPFAFLCLLDTAVQVIRGLFGAQTQ